jgi:hypothetical protein
MSWCLRRSTCGSRRITGSALICEAADPESKGIAEKQPSGSMPSPASPGRSLPTPPDRSPDGQPRPGRLPRRLRHLHLQPPRALCTHGDGPDLGTCQPLRCRNAAFTPANRDALQAELAKIDASLSQAPALPPYLQHTLTARRQAITALLARQEDEAV